MAMSYVARVSDGVTQQFDLPFGYLSRQHVFVFVEDALRAFKWISGSRVELLAPALPGEIIKIRRLTERAARVTNYVDGQTLLAGDLNDGDLQNFYIMQELIDQLTDGIALGDVSVLNPDGGWITAQWIADQIDAAAPPDTLIAFANALADEALARAAAIADEALARGAAITAEAAARTAEVLALTTDLEAEAATRTAEVLALTTDLEAEATTRTADVLALTEADADTVGRLVIVESDLNTPTTGVKAKLVTVENAVTTETSARASADTAILAEIDTPATGLKARATSLESRTTAVEIGKAEASELTALSARVTTAEADITAAEAAITSEATTRATDDTAIASSVTALTARVTTAEADITAAEAAIVTANSAIATETTARASADTAILAEIDTPGTGLKARATSLESRTTAVEANKAEASALTALAARVTTAEADITAAEAAITSEATTRATDDTAIATSVTALAARVTTAEADITAAEAAIVTANDAIATETSARASADAAILAEINDPTTGLKARATSLESRTTAVEANKAEASALTALSSEVNSQAASTNDALNNNAKFAQIQASGIVPPGWADWSAGWVNSSSYAHPSLPSRYGWRHSKTSSDSANFGIGQYNLPVSGGRKYLLRASARRLSGSFGSSGVYVSFFDAADGYLDAWWVPFKTGQTTNGEVVGEYPDGVHTWEAIVTAPAGAVRSVLHAMTGWEVFGASVAVDMLWYECGLYASESPELAAAQAKADIVSEATTRATEDTAIASSVTALTARVTTAESDINAAEAAIVTTNDAIAAETGARTTQVNALDTRVGTAEAGLVTVNSTVSDLQANKAEASTVTALTASFSGRVAGGIINANPFFDEGPTSSGVIPARWSDWARGHTCGVTDKPFGGAGLCARMDPVSGTPVDVGWVQDLGQGSVRGSNKYKIRADLARGTGSLVSSGVLISWYDAANSNVAIDRMYFGLDADTSGVVTAYGDGRRVWEQTVTAPATATKVVIYAMQAWSGFGGAAQASTPQLFWLECSISHISSDTARITSAEADIVTESAARVSGDSANATTIENNRASFQAQEQFPNLIADTSFSTQNWQLGWDGPSGLSVSGLGRNFEGVHVPGVLDVAYRHLVTGSWEGPGIGFATVYDLATYAPGGSRANAPTVTPGQLIYASAYVAYDRLTSVEVLVMWLDAAGNYITEVGVGVGGVSFGARGGLSTMQKVGGYLTVPSGVSKASMFFRAHVPVGSINPYMWVAAPQLCRVDPGTSGDIPWSKQSSAVTFLREALATNDTSVARLLLGVNTSTNVATIEAVAQEGSGVWNGAAITLNADLISLLAKSINFGANTVFEDTKGTLYTSTGGNRVRILGPFGTSSDLVMWYGPTSVALNSETKTNGAFALATDGKVYLGTEVAGALSAAQLSSYYVVGFTSSVSAYSTVVTASAQGGDGTYTYSWMRTSQAGTHRVTCSDVNIAAPTFTVAAAGYSEDVWTCTVTETSTGRSRQAAVAFHVQDIGGGL